MANPGRVQELDEDVRQLLQQEATWRERRGVQVPQPSPGSAQQGNQAWDAQRLGPKPRHVGPRAQRTESLAQYAWDEEHEVSDGQTSLFDMFVVVGLKSGEPVIYYKYDVMENTNPKGRKGYEQIQVRSGAPPSLARHFRLSAIVCATL